MRPEASCVTKRRQDALQVFDFPFQRVQWCEESKTEASFSFGRLDQHLVAVETKVLAISGDLGESKLLCNFLHLD